MTSTIILTMIMLMIILVLVMIIRRTEGTEEQGVSDPKHLSLLAS